VYSVDFYHAILCRMRYYNGKLSVHLSVMLICCGHVHWASSNVIMFLVGLGSLVSAAPNIINLVQGEQPQISGGIGVGY